ncbi:hypothetical protein BCF74_10647 [Knoellia remsis]|uniref:Uncharacterized protein n=1 Tax=Knoellia remsis TaxID=407159 RepID=A0A2T0UTP0_9MICO|nr:hypothetical protein [Knoellia remsis]PRY61299.1 hypothetical protein BCF74_10647 [Knoellia remsis]
MGTEDYAGIDEFVLLIWGLRVLLVILGSVLFGVFLGSWWLIARPVFTEALRAKAAQNWWLPFLPRADGSWGPLTSNRWWAVFRAQQPTTRRALVVRWAFWAYVALVFTLMVPYAGCQIVRLLSLGWV